MSEQKLSISFRIDKGCIEHNNRDIIASNVDISRTPDNITYTKIDIKEFYGQLFDEALADYNAKRRPYLRIENYYDHIRNGKQEKPFEEIVCARIIRFAHNASEIRTPAVLARRIGKRRKKCSTFI